jgi:hypothetical protein
VTAGSDRRVHEEPPAFRREDLQNLLEEDRRVLPFPNVFRLPSPVSRRSTRNSHVAAFHSLHDISSFDISS